MIYPSKCGARENGGHFLEKSLNEDILDIIEDLPEEIEEGQNRGICGLRTTGSRKRRQGSYAFCGRATVTISRPRFLDS
jgi:hypothetical protein